MQWKHQSFESASFSSLHAKSEFATLFTDLEDKLRKSASKQQTIEAATGGHVINCGDLSIADKRIMNLIACNNLSFGLVQDEAFKAQCKFDLKARVITEAATSQPSTPKAAVTDEVVNITYVTRNGTEKRIQGKIGDNVMYLAHDHNIEIEGACEASLACCTCHVYVDENFYNKLPAPVEDEEDMLDMAPLLKPNSRLSCQIILNKELDGIKVTLPNITRNFYVDGHVPEPH
uniref:2Fe-2S ferredoxin-type domain-containing protein n=1 Tax=Globodera pallida TaxID=36090 RepID=A0A183C9F2_GLOPA